VAAELTPALTRWIKSLEAPDDWFCVDVLLENTEKLVNKVISWLDHDGRTKELEMADALRKSVKAVRRISSVSDST
jgi:hypothetical protein